MTKFMLTIYEFDDDSPKVSTGPIYSVQANTITELVSKIPILVLEIQESIIRKELEKARHDGDIPF